MQPPTGDHVLSVARSLSFHSCGFPTEPTSLISPQGWPVGKGSLTWEYNLLSRGQLCEGFAMWNYSTHRDYFALDNALLSRIGHGDLAGKWVEVFQHGSFLKLGSDCSLRPFQMPATVGHSRRCSLECSRAVRAQVTVALANGKWELICSKGPNWLMVQFRAYYFKAVFLAPAWQACLRHLATMIRMPLFFKEAHHRFIYGLTRKDSFSRANMFQRKVYFH